MNSHEFMATVPPMDYRAEIEHLQSEIARQEARILALERAQAERVAAEPTPTPEDAQALDMLAALKERVKKP